MRIVLAAAAALAVTVVSGCDINNGPAKTAKVECNCAAPATPPSMHAETDAAPPPAPAPYHDHSYRHRHGHGVALWNGGHSHIWRREYAELSVATYDYHSGSHSYDTDGDVHGEGYAGGDAHDGGYHAAEHGWIDGYGRGHAGGTDTDGAVRFEGHGHEHGRADPWHGYDIDCPNPDR